LLGGLTFELDQIKQAGQFCNQDRPNFWDEFSPADQLWLIAEELEVRRSPANRRALAPTAS
jgi:hypothetical protein